MYTCSNYRGGMKERKNKRKSMTVFFLRPARTNKAKTTEATTFARMVRSAVNRHFALYIHSNEIHNVAALIVY